MTRRCRAASRSSPRPSTGAIDTTTTRRHVTRTRQRLAIAGTAAALAAAVSLVGGAFRESGGSARAVPILHAAASEPLESGLANGNTTKLVAKRPRPSRSPGRRSELHPARPRLPAAGPRDGQPRLLHEVRRNAAPRARPRPRRRDDDERAGLALAGSTPLWTGTRTREASRGGSALHLSELRRARRCPRRARPLPRGIQRLRPDELALDSAGGEPEPSAWTQTQLGKLAWSHGRVDAAERHFRAALAIFPGYVYALEPLALVEEATGHPARVIALARRAAEVLPLPQSVATLGDLLAHHGRRQAAQRQYALVGVIERLLVANGVRTELETALFDVDHGVHMKRALGLARRAHEVRPSIDADDILAWALARSGRCSEALPYSRHALRLGTLDATKLFHRGMIERCLGRPVALNPYFSLLWSETARRFAA